ncbi:MAG: recombinase family protein, partial [Oscillospiraceae bacterium]
TLPKAVLFLVQMDFEDLPQIVEEEAKTVRRIYALFIGGMTAHGIAKQLTEEEIPTPDGKKMRLQTRWKAF